MGQKNKFLHLYPKLCHVTPHFAHFYINNPNSGLKTVNLKSLSQYDGKCVKMGSKMDFWHFYPKVCRVTPYFAHFYINKSIFRAKNRKFEPNESI